MLWSYLDSIRFTVLSLDPGDSCSVVTFFGIWISFMLSAIKPMNNKAEAC